MSCTKYLCSSNEQEFTDELPVEEDSNGHLGSLRSARSGRSFGGELSVGFCRTLSMRCLRDSERESRKYTSTLAELTAPDVFAHRPSMSDTHATVDLVNAQRRILRVGRGTARG